MNFSKETDKILFIDLPPLTLYKDQAVSHKGVNYIRAYLNQNNIQNSCYVLDYDYLKEIYYNHLIIASKSLKEKVVVTPQQFEKFERNGFTVVEWGGSEIK